MVTLAEPTSDRHPHLRRTMTLDPVTGLYYERYRNYSPALGTWISQDPLSYINGVNTYQFVTSNPVGAVDSSGLATYITSGSHPFNPMRAGIVIASDRTMYYKYVYTFDYRNAGGYPDVGSARLLGYTVSGADIPDAAAPIWIPGAPDVTITAGYYLEINSVTAPLPTNGSQCDHAVLVMITLHAYNEDAVKISLMPQAVELTRTDLGTWHDFYVVYDHDGEVHVAPLLGPPKMP